MARIVPMPKFTDPNLPEAAGGSINFGVGATAPPFSSHPVQHSADYAGGLLEEDGPGGSIAVDTSEYDDRSEWTKAQWVELAAGYDLATSGTKDEIIQRVTEHEESLGEGSE